MKPAKTYRLYLEWSDKTRNYYLNGLGNVWEGNLEQVNKLWAANLQTGIAYGVELQTNKLTRERAGN
jgi:hypothetical protein